MHLPGASPVLFFSPGGFLTCASGVTDDHRPFALLFFLSVLRPSRWIPQGDFDQHLASKGHKKKSAPPKPPSEARRPAKVKKPPPTFTGPDAALRYGNQVISQDLNRAAAELLRKLHEFQERTRALEPLKAKAKRRLVFGLRQVQKALRTRKAKMVMFAPNIEEVEARGAFCKG